MPELKPYKGGTYYLWHYIPSLPAAVVFIVLFAGATAYNCWRMYKTKAWFSVVLVIGGLFQVIGYAGRAAAPDKTDQLGPYIVQSLMILLAPTLYAASIYMTLGRIIRSVNGERHSLVPVRWLTRIFVAGDVLSFVIQGGGAGLMVKGTDPKMGETMIVGGLAIQVIIFGVFWATAVVFHVKLRRWPTARSLEANSTWKSSLLMLYGVSALIMIRSLFRIVEYVMGSDGYPLSHEWTLYVFDSALMLGVMVVYAVWFPGELQIKQEIGGDTDISMDIADGNQRIEPHQK